MIYGFLIASVDRLYWAIFGRRDSRVPPKGLWTSTLFAGIGGAAGAYALSYTTSTVDLLTSVIGGFIGGRLVSGIIETVFNRAKGSEIPQFDHGGIQTPQDPIPLRVVQVTIPASVAFNFDKMVEINKTVLDKLGCPTCHSGFDIRYDFEQVFEFDEKLNLVESLKEG